MYGDGNSTKLVKDVMSSASQARAWPDGYFVICIDAGKERKVPFYILYFTHTCIKVVSFKSQKLANYVCPAVPEGKEGNAYVDQLAICEDGTLWVTEGMYVWGSLPTPDQVAIVLPLAQAHQASPQGDQLIPQVFPLQGKALTGVGRGL